MNITKLDLVTKLVDSLDMNKKDAKLLVDNFFAEIVNSLQEGDEVKISGFGAFSVRNKGTRPGRNFHTNEEITIESRKVIKFKQGQALKNLLQIEHIGA